MYPLVQAHLRLLARVCGSRSPDLLVVPVPVPVPVSVPAFPCFPVAPRLMTRFLKHLKNCEFNLNPGDEILA